MNQTTNDSTQNVQSDYLNDVTSSQSSSSPSAQQPKLPGSSRSQKIPVLDNLDIGNGTTTIHLSPQGLWSGAKGFDDAPISIDMEGNITIRHGGNITIKDSGNLTLGNGGNIHVGDGGSITVGSGDNSIVLQPPDGIFIGGDSPTNSPLQMVNGRITIRDKETEDIIEEIGSLDGDNRVGMRVADQNSLNRFFAGRDGSFYGYKLSKPDKDVFNSSDADLLLSSQISFIQFQFSTFRGVPNGATSETTGFLNFADDMGGVHNFAVVLDFFKPDDITFVYAELQTKFRDAIDIFGDYTQVADAKIYLNPDITKTPGTDVPSQFVDRFSNGITIRDTFAPGSDEIIRDILPAETIADINNGWNSVVVQNETQNGNVASYCTVNLVLVGYKTH